MYAINDNLLYVSQSSKGYVCYSLHSMFFKGLKATYVCYTL